MRVVIGEDEALLREGLALILEQAGFTVAGVTGHADELVSLAAMKDPHLVITDIRMPPDYTDDGLRAAVQIRATRPETAVLALSQHVNRRYAHELLGDRPSGVGYLLKQRVADVDTFCHDIHQVAAGGTVLDPEVVSTMLTRSRTGTDILDALTPRQSEILALVAQGRSNAAIATKLNVSERAVVNQTSRIYDTLKLAPSADDHRRVLAVIHFLDR